MVQTRKTSTNKFRRDAWVDINLNNLEYNLKALYKEFKKPLIPILKADAYGHGSTVIAKTLDAYEFVLGYGVASIDEALELRGVSNKRIIILGISPAWALEEAIKNNIELSIVNLASAEQINRVAEGLGSTAIIHIKLDTGMNRIGLKIQDSGQIQAISKLANVQIASIFTHFADPEDLEFSESQKQQFIQMTKGLDYPLHPATSSVARTLSGIEFDYVRCGIELYGLGSSLFKPVLSLFARISHIKDINKGESVSYKQSWRAKENTRIITLPLGYADGISRALSNKIQAYYRDEHIKQVGWITMDQMMFEIATLDAELGDIVELIGPHCPVNNWAKAIDTISYEIVSTLNLRLAKTYSR
jgi:alanine racemase